jgi:hypothetical protein
MNDWLTKNREETHVHRMPDRLLGDILVTNPALGINIYNKAIPEKICDDSIRTLEENLGEEFSFNWQPAIVTESNEPLLEARFCVDFKVGHKNLGERNINNSVFYDMHESVFRSIYPCALDYGSYWGVGINYFEVFNFVKYESPGHHFNIHADHGPAYVTTVSIVAYLNDDYEGGELHFPRFDLTIKPNKGDVVLFPSTFIYEHSSELMVSGTKYSVVIMTDYNSRGNLRYYAYREQDNQLAY